MDANLYGKNYHIDKQPGFNERAREESAKTRKLKAHISEQVVKQVKVRDREMLERIKEVVRELPENMLDNDFTNTQRGLLILAYETVQEQIKFYKKKIKKETRKEVPDEAMIMKWNDSIDRLLINMSGEMRKINEGGHTMKFGKRSVNVNVPMPAKASIKDLMEIPNKNLSEEEEPDEEEDKPGWTDTTGSESGD